MFVLLGTRIVDIAEIGEIAHINICAPCKWYNDSNMKNICRMCRCIKIVCNRCFRYQESFRELLFYEPITYERYLARMLFQQMQDIIYDY